MINYIPLYFNPYPDETAFSWINRLAKENGLPVNQFSDAYLGTENAKAESFSYDARAQLSALFAHVRTPVDIRDAFLSVSTLPFESCAMAQSTIARYINNVFQPPGMFNNKVGTLIREARICPECMKEDIEKYGEPYLHRVHQLTGVNVCHKHGTWLHEYHSEREGEGPARRKHLNTAHACDFSFSSYKEVPHGHLPADAAAYASYAADILGSGIVTDAKAVSEVIRERMDGYWWNYETFASDYQKWEHASLGAIKDPERLFREKLPRGRSLFAGEVVPLLMFLFPDVQKFIQRLAEYDSCLKEYTCPVCGTRYLSAAGNEWVCPKCSRDVPEAELFQQMVDVAGDGEYTAITRPENAKDKVLFLHEPCGRQTWISASRFLFCGARCPCQNPRAPLDLEAEVNSIPGFKYQGLAKTRKNKSISVVHERCGRQFVCDYYVFKKNRKCPICEVSTVTEKTFAERVKDIVGDEYDIVGEYVSSRTPIEMRHNACGKTFLARPESFLRGARCPECKKPERQLNVEEELDEYGSGRYSLKEYRDGSCEIYDAMKDGAILLPKPLLLQEMRRPTPSPILPVDPEHTDGFTRYWDKMYALLLEHIRETDSTVIDRELKYKGVILGRWLSAQRRRLKEGTLDPDKADLLIKAGVCSPVTVSANKKWHIYYSLYEQYTFENGSPYIAVQQDYAGKKLGMWVYRQRQNERCGKLLSERKEQLLSIDPDFFSQEVLWERALKYRMEKKNS